MNRDENWWLFPSEQWHQQEESAPSPRSERVSANCSLSAAPNGSKWQAVNGITIDRVDKTGSELHPEFSARRKREEIPRETTAAAVDGRPTSKSASGSMQPVREVRRQGGAEAGRCGGRDETRSAGDGSDFGSVSYT
jgi:hypothetical protein